MSATPSWVESYTRLCAKNGGGLALMGLDRVEIGVYIYLFYRLVGDGDAAASASGIVNRLSPILCHIRRNIARTSPPARSAQH